MKFHLKIFLLSFMACTVVFGTAMGAYNHFYKSNITDLAEGASIEAAYETHENDADKTELERRIDKSNRVNFLLFGTDGGRSDTIMVLSYDPVNQIADLISIPRDTYHPMEGQTHPAKKKINAVFGLKDQGGPQGLKKEISRVLKIPIAYYVKVEYEGIEKIVDSVGGVEMNVPFNMNYDDSYADPPLHIHLNEGEQTLNGNQAIQFLRWRKNNGHGGDGDLPRTARQQDFIKAMAKKSFSIKLPVVLKTAFDFVDTDMKLDKILFIGSTAASLNLDDLTTQRIPGEAGDSKYGYYMVNEEETEKMMLSIYGKQRNAEGVIENIDNQTGTTTTSN